MSFSKILILLVILFVTTDSTVVNNTTTSNHIVNSYHHVRIQSLTHIEILGRSGGSRSGGSRSGGSRSGGSRAGSSGRPSRTNGGTSGGSKPIPPPKTQSSRSSYISTSMKQNPTYKTVPYKTGVTGYKTPVLSNPTRPVYIGPYSRYPRIGFIPRNYALVVLYIYLLSDFDNNNYDYNMDGYSDTDEECTVYNITKLSNINSINMTEIIELHNEQNYNETELLYYITNIGYLNVTEYDAYLKHQYVLTVNGTFIFNFTTSWDVNQDNAIFTECENSASVKSISYIVLVITYMYLIFLYN